MQRILRPFIALLRRGITPEKLALSVALGMTLGVFPALGLTTLLCLAAGFLLKLNQPALQSVNYIAYPLQIGLLIPFYRLGETLFHAPHLDISVDGVKALIASGIWNSIQVLWDTTLHAIVAWGLVAPFAVAVLYFSTRPIFARLIVK